MGIGFQFTIDFAFAMLRKRPRRGDDEHAAWEVSCSRFGPSISELSLTLPESSVAESKRRNGLTALAVGAVSAACIGIPLARSGLDVSVFFCVSCPGLLNTIAMHRALARGNMSSEPLPCSSWLPS